MIVAHHGGELLALAPLVGAGAVPPLLMLVRARLHAAGARLRRRR